MARSGQPMYYVLTVSLRLSFESCATFVSLNFTLSYMECTMVMCGPVASRPSRPCCPLSWHHSLPRHPEPLWRWWPHWRSPPGTGAKCSKPASEVPTSMRNSCMPACVSLSPTIWTRGLRKGRDLDLDQMVPRLLSLAPLEPPQVPRRSQGNCESGSGTGVYY